MSTFEEMLSEEINTAKTAYQNQVFTGESPEYMRGFHTGVLFCLYETQRRLKEDKEKTAQTKPQ